MLLFRIAVEDDTNALSALAYHSENYLGYDQRYMDKFKLLYNITIDFLKDNPVYILEDNNNILGFWGLLRTASAWELEFFYISPNYIGKGHGRILWIHLLDTCKNMGITEFNFVTSPQSAAFYKKMGADVIGQIESRITEGRMIPMLNYTLRPINLHDGGVPNGQA